MAGVQMVEIEAPEDLGVKIVSKLESKWTDARDKAIEAIQIDTMNIEISEMIVKIADKWIKSEQAKEKERLK